MISWDRPRSATSPIAAIGGAAKWIGDCGIGHEDALRRWLRAQKRGAASGVTPFQHPAGLKGGQGADAPVTTLPRLPFGPLVESGNSLARAAAVATLAPLLFVAAKLLVRSIAPRTFALWLGRAATVPEAGSAVPPVRDGCRGFT
jgi:hypothetical protein